MAENDWLDKDGICHFTGEAAKMPSGVWIAGGFTDLLELVVGIVWNKPGPGFAVMDWDVGQPIPKEVADRVLGLKMDTETINYIQAENDGRGILLAEAGGDAQENGITPAQWQEKYHSNGVATIARMRFFKFVKGGGVHF